jgi:hypothetical protein
VNILVWLILSALAAFRLAELFVIDDGPFDVFSNLRGWANKPPLDEHAIRRTLAGILSCVHCAGLWICIIFGVVFYLSNSTTITESILFTFAVAGLQSVLAIQFGRTY